MEGPLTSKVLEILSSFTEEEPTALLTGLAQQDQWVQGDRSILPQGGMRAAVYARVASSENAQEEIERQIRRCRERAAHYGWEVAAVYQDVGPGLELQRRGLMALREAVTAGNVDVLFIRDIARLSRSPMNLLSLLTWFLSHDVAIADLSQPEGERFLCLAKTTVGQ